MKTSKFRFEVVVEVNGHEDLSKPLVAAHIRAAVESWGGQYRPDHPLFPTRISRVAVKKVKS